MGFINDVKKVIKALPAQRQNLLFSATMPPEIQRLADQFLSNPIRVEASRPATTAATVAQYVVPAGKEAADKRAVLRKLVREATDLTNAIIFCNRKRDVAIVHRSLQRHGFNAGALHGDMDQTSRMATLDSFRDGRITLLAASDVAARGLDIPNVSHIFNFDVPWQPDDYVHRIGRTGRAGKEGFSATLVTADDLKAVAAISKLIGEDTKWIGDAPDADTIAEGMSRRGRGRGKPVRRNGKPGGMRGRERPDRGKHSHDSLHQAPRSSGTHGGDNRPSQTPRSAEGRRDSRPEQPAARERHQPRRQDDRPARDARPSREQPQAAKPNQPPRDKREGGQRQGERAPVGLGEHVPAFLRRPVRAAGQ
jgi:superfamily II DNA/RNA helicase